MSNFSKLRVKELKGILSGWGEQCSGCVDKNQYISKINSLKVQCTWIASCPALCLLQDKYAPELGSKLPQEAKEL